MADAMHQVSFVDVKDIYPLETPIQCRYIVKQEFIGSSRDWIGLYKVGCRSCNKYETYAWAQTPTMAEGDSRGGVREGLVSFPAGSLPKDSKEFYQFCYVSNGDQVCGVSPPFQLCSSVDDLVEVQDPDDPTTMIIKTKAQLLEEEIVALKMDRLDLQKEVQLLQIELDAERVSKGQLMTQLQKLTQMQEEMDIERKNYAFLNEQIRELQNTLQTERRSNEQLHEQIRAMRDDLLSKRKATENVKHQQKKGGPCQEMQIDAGYETVEGESGKDSGVKKYSAEGDGAEREASELKQMSLTERITGSLLKHLKKASDWLAEDFGDDDYCHGDQQGVTTGPAVPMTKLDESLRLCPICRENFPENASEVEISARVECHNGEMCPICYMQFDRGHPKDKVVLHVNSHPDSPNDNILSF